MGLGYSLYELGQHIEIAHYVHGGYCLTTKILQKICRNSAYIFVKTDAIIKTGYMKLFYIAVCTTHLESQLA